MEIIATRYKETVESSVPKDWFRKKIKDISPLQRGFDLPSTGLIKGEYPVVYSNGIGFYHRENMVKGPGVITGRSGTLGKIHFILKDYWPHNTTLWVTNFYNNNPKFIYYLLQFVDVGRFGTGSGVPTLNRNDVHDYKIALPPTLTEQKAIAQVLSDTDALIQALEKKIAKKKLIKQGVMQKLLTPKEGWVVKALDDILTFGSGQDYKHLSQGNIPVHGTGGIMTFVNDFLYDGDSVGIGRKGTIDKPVFLSGKFWTVDTLFYTHSFVNTIPKFIYYTFFMIPWKAYNEASGVPSLNKYTLGKIEIALPPTIKEQKQIAQTITDMDKEIGNLAQKLSKYQLAKQGMMQQLLTGKIRLV